MSKRWKREYSEEEVRAHLDEVRERTRMRFPPLDPAERLRMESRIALRSLVPNMMHLVLETLHRRGVFSRQDVVQLANKAAFAPLYRLTPSWRRDLAKRIDADSREVLTGGHGNLLNRLLSVCYLAAELGSDGVPVEQDALLAAAPIMAEAQDPECGWGDRREARERAGRMRDRLRGKGYPVLTPASAAPGLGGEPTDPA